MFGTDTETFSLDAVGNRTAHSKVSGVWTHDADNRLLQQGNAASYEYDEAGNLTKKTAGGKITRYSYDTRNRLTEVKDNSNNLIARYGYDPMDRRAWKEQYRDRDGNPLAQAKRTCYLYADEGLIAETSQDITLNADQTVTPNGEAQIASQYGPRPNAVFTTGMLFVKMKDSNGQDIFAYYHHDHLGTPIQATDKLGNVVWAASYEPFGKATITTPAATPEKPTISSILRFPGQMEDAETGLHYNWHRYYDPEIGRYVTADPIGLKGGVNLFVYVQGDPMNWVDPEGLEVWRCSRPVDGLPGQPSPPVLHHDYVCATDKNGKLHCGSTTPTTKDYWVGTPARPSTSRDGDYYDPNACKKEDPSPSNCVEECVIGEINRPSRPPFAIGPLGTDCQEWTDDVLKKCTDECSAEKWRKIARDKYRNVTKN